MARPYLAAGDDQIIAVDSSASPQASQVRPRVGLGETLAPDDFALEDPRKMVLPLGLGSTRHDGRTGMIQCDEAQVMVGGIRTSVFLVPDELPGERKAQPTIFLRPGNARPTGVMLKRLPGQVVCAGCGSGMGSPLSRDVFMQPVTRLGAKCDVFGREVQVQPVPRGIFQPSGAYSSFKKMTIRHLYYHGRRCVEIRGTKH